ncbi:MAG: SUMF1/EgtB/PvdO family nonheme iron enzyme [Deltaproteobacteria bacterium]|nr:SUMF1/EgtB/PvdO family nonheme iron enzyme [Deltaproteobacteria bacterium]
MNLHLLNLKKTLFLFIFLSGCFVKPVCYNDADCPQNEFCSIVEGSKEGECISRCTVDGDCAGVGICDLASGLCIEPECVNSEDCPFGYECYLNNCRAAGQIVCPDDMRVIDNSFCIDTYEASRSDATFSLPGTDEKMATSRGGVIPWQVWDNQTAEAACEAAGKMLCTGSQWQRACSGPDDTVYGYGDKYEPATCNGIDTFCFCDSVINSGECPYPHCYHDVGAAFRLEPTGSFKGCTNGFGVFDMNGNLWEYVAGGSDYSVRGGAFNCSDSEKLHSCSYVPGSWTPSARGFRCCSAGEIIMPDDSDSDSGETGK